MSESATRKPQHAFREEIFMRIDFRHAFDLNAAPHLCLVLGVYMDPSHLCKAINPAREYSKSVTPRLHSRAWPGLSQLCAWSGVDVLSLWYRYLIVQPRQL
jgi:hypothetical protein